MGDTSLEVMTSEDRNRLDGNKGQGHDKNRHEHGQGVRVALLSSEDVRGG